MRIFLNSLILLCFWSEPTLAQYLHPEYQSLSEDRVKAFYDPDDIEMEYESDLMHFLPSFSHLNYYYQSPNSFLGSVGSLGKKQFMVRQGAKFRTRLGDRVDFGFVQFGEEDFDNQHSAVIFEFLLWNLNRRIGLVIFGEANYLKAQDDVGLGLEWILPTGRGRFYALKSDYARNERNENSDRHDKPPLTLGFLFEDFPNDIEFTRFNASWQFHSVWNFPDENIRYSSRQGQIQVLRRKEVRQGIYANSMVYFEELNQNQSDSGVKVRNTYRLSRSYERDRLEGGLWYTHYDFERLGDRLKYNFFQPYLWISKKPPSASSRWRMGLSGVIGDRDGGNLAFDPEDTGSEYRLTLAWERRNFEVHFAFDLDRFGKSDTWEGGNMRVQADF